MDAADRRALLARLKRDAERMASHFGLRLHALRAEHPRVTSRYGACYLNGVITIRLNHARTGEALRYSSLIDTLCHELAHLRHFNHGPEFKAFFWEILGWARHVGIYRPRPRGRRNDPAIAAQAPAPQQLALPQRNGVPVFAAPLTPPPSAKAPWEQSAVSGAMVLEKALQGAVATPRSSCAPPAACTPSAPRFAAPRQLNLF